MTNGLKIERGYFGLGSPQETVVKVTSTADFTISLWARNVETSHGGVQILTPPSQFRGPSSTGPEDGLVLDVPPQTGMDLGYIGARENELSSGGESHPSALTEPDVKLSPHPAPTLQPPVARRAATGQTSWGPAARLAPASASTRVLDV